MIEVQEEVMWKTLYEKVQSEKCTVGVETEREFRCGGLFYSIFREAQKDTNSYTVSMSTVDHCKRIEY